MNNLTLEDLWASAVEGAGLEDSTDEEMEELKLFFYAGAYSLINQNYYLQTNSETKNDYIAAMDALQQECLDVHKAAEPDKKPFLKIVK